MTEQLKIASIGECMIELSQPKASRDLQKAQRSFVRLSPVTPSTPQPIWCGSFLPRLKSPISPAWARYAEPEHA